MNTFTITGLINKDGIFKVTNKPEMDAFFRQFTGCPVIAKAEVFQEPSNAMIGYYYSSIVPDFREAFKQLGEHKTLTEVDVQLREMSSIMHEEIPKEQTGGFELVRTLTIDEAGTHRAYQFIQDLIRIAAEDFGFVIREPRIL